MEHYNHIIKASVMIIDALKKLETISGEILCLFITNSNEELVGSITDGDIRRYLITGGNVSDNVLKAANLKCFYIKGDISLDDIKYFRTKGISLVPRVDRNGHINDIFDFSIHKSYLPIDAVLMAGGKGERLRPLTEKTPKPLLKVGSKAIIDYNIESLISYGVKNISVTINYLKEQIEDHFSMPIKGVAVNCVREPMFLGTIGSIKFVDNFNNDTVLVMNSDLFTNINYEDFYAHFKEHNADMSVAAVPYTVSVPYGIFDLEGREIQGLIEKPTYNYYANAGIYLIKRDLIKKIPNDKFYNATDFIELLISENRKVIRFPIAGYWIDIGKHEEFKKAQDLVKHLHF